MVDSSIERVSALAGHFSKGCFAPDDAIGVVLQEALDLTLFQIAAWPDTLSEVGNKAAEAAGAGIAPGLGKSITGSKGTLLRVEPLKFWLVGAVPSHLSPDEGSTLDLSHSRTRLRVSGSQAVALLNRQLPIDLREESFPVGSVASSAFHHVGVTLWRSEAGYELFLPRGYALSLWELLREGAAQFGFEVM